ncbi:MAG: geranylgeranylglycerol-phosphate geranylgeranyltransferase [Ignavibacteria bacterium]|nr:geranylgeranylglycerol-phosphate geranylgeranyltransferase [Ignavibacteria bacterium]
MPAQHLPARSRTRAAAFLGLLSLMRPLNGVIAVAGVFATGVIAGADSGMYPRLLLAGIAAFLLGSAGNIVNDLRDVAIDVINKPRRALAAGRVTRRAAIAWGLVCAGTGILCSAPLGPEAFGIAVASMALMVLYSVSFKHIPLLGNATVGIVTGLAFIFAGYAAGNPAAGIVPGAFACAFNVARELLKDIEDMEGDRACGVRTFPLVHGTAATLALTSAIFAIIIAGSFVPWLLDLYSARYLVIVVAGVDLVLAASAAIMWISPRRSTIARLCTVLKFDMLVGMTALMLGTK